MNKKFKAPLNLLGIMAIIPLAACGILPASGPYSLSMDSQAIAVTSTGELKDDKSRYAIIKITKENANFLTKKFKNKNNMAWPAMGTSNITGVSVGDTVSITIYESESGGLFIPVEAGVRPGNYVNIPSQTIDNSGIIMVPFAGAIKAAGRTPAEIGEEIEEKLGMRAIEPQAIVSVVDRKGAEVSVLGEVGTSTKFTLGFNGEKILDAISRAGGPRNPGHETYVTLQRAGKEYTLPFDSLVKDPKKNIFLRAKDTIYLAREAASFQVYGASGSNGIYNFRKSDINLSEAIGEARGLNDSLADPEEIYLYRQENVADIENMGIALEYTEQERNSTTIPVIYKLNLREPNGFFLAQMFPVENKDIVYIANAESVEFTKFLNLLNPTAVTKINTHDAINRPDNNN